MKIGSKSAIRSAAIVVVLFVVLVGVGILFIRPTLSFSILLDGQPLPPGLTADVKVDGIVFASGDKLGYGEHVITVALKNTEPLTTKFHQGLSSKRLAPLKMESISGAMTVTTSPNNCNVTLRQGGAVVGRATSPARFEKLLFGDYDLEVEKSDYKEVNHMLIDEKTPKAIEVRLKLGVVNLSSVPADADYVLTGGGHNRNGHLPSLIPDVPVGDYELIVRRKGWEIRSDLVVETGMTSTSKTVFAYGAISVVSEPPEAAIFLDGVSVGKSPLTVSEIRPATYVLSASDHENELSGKIIVQPNQVTNHTFSFHYGTIQLISVPPGARVTKDGKGIGVTPLTLNPVPSGQLSLEMHKDGYVTTNFMVTVLEKETLTITNKLISERFKEAMIQARVALKQGLFAEAKRCVASALEIDPNDTDGILLREEVDLAPSKAERALQQEKADAKARELDSLTWLSFPKLVADCTDLQVVQAPVVLVDGYYENYVDSEGKKRQRFHETGKHSEMQVTTNATWNPSKFAEKYEGRIFGFNCPDRWRISKVDKDGVVVVKGGGLLSDEIRVTPATGSVDAFKALQKGDKFTIKSVVKRYEQGFLGRKLFFEQAEIVTK